MKYTEELSWILDKVGGKLGDEENYRKNIDFVHSLGLKCDCVGWSVLDLSNPRTPEIFNAIKTFCQENGWQARCCYRRRYTDIESDWYELVPVWFKDNTLSDWSEALTENGEKVKIAVIRAFHEMNVAPKSGRMEVFVPERLRNFYIENGLSGLDFCWAKDKGKYQAEQYFQTYGQRLIPHLVSSYHLDRRDKAEICKGGGWLPKIAEVFHEIQRIDMPDCYLRTELPADGIAYAYIPVTPYRVCTNTLLIHKDIAEKLLQQRILPARVLRPAPIVDELPGGYILEETQPIPRPAQRIVDSRLAEYEKMKKVDRPVRMVSEKEALKVLCSAKKERKEEFRKALPKAKGQEVLDSDYASLLPYYLVTNGGFLSDEYELLPYAQALVANEEFFKNLEAEELLEEKPEGIVIAKCPDGDSVLLCNDGLVIRFSHEEPVTVEQWPSLSQFFADAVDEM